MRMRTRKGRRNKRERKQEKGRKKKEEGKKKERKEEKENKRGKKEKKRDCNTRYTADCGLWKTMAMLNGNGSGEERDTRERGRTGRDDLLERNEGQGGRQKAEGGRRKAERKKRENVGGVEDRRRWSGEQGNQVDGTEKGDDEEEEEEEKKQRD